MRVRPIVEPAYWNIIVARGDPIESGLRSRAPDIDCKTAYEIQLSILLEIYVWFLQHISRSPNFLIFNDPPLLSSRIEMCTLNLK